MKAAVFEDVKKIIYKEDYPTPKPGPDEVLVKVYYCAICGSDITNFKYKLYKTPLIMGHEFSGEIAEIGENVKNFQIGEKVVGINIIPEGNYADIRGMGIFRDGGFAEYVIVHREDLFHTPANLTFKECSMIESYAVAVRGVKASNVPQNENIAIIGGGNIGLTTLGVLLSGKNPNYVIIIEPYEFLREKAIEFGATDSFPPTKAKMRNFFKLHGAPNYIFECSGNENGFKLGMELINKGGTILLESIFKGNISFPFFLINNKELTIKGTISHSKADVFDAIKLFAEKKVDPLKLISEEIPLNDIQKGFEKFLDPKERNFIKILVKL